MNRRSPRWTLLVLGMVSVLCGVALLVWLASPFLDWGDNQPAVSRHLRQDLRRSWDTSHPAEPHPKLGAAFALIRIPRLGLGWEEPVIEGVGPAMLAEGIGHYPETQLPGQIGNFAVAGHRITHGSPFRELLSLVPGDRVVVETRTAVYTYVIDRPPADLTVSNRATWVLEPVPGHPRQRPTIARITLTTCTDFFRSLTRSVAFGHLIKTIYKNRV